MGDKQKSWTRENDDNRGNMIREYVPSYEDKRPRTYVSQESDMDLLRKLPVRFTEEDDGIVISVQTDRGPRTVDYNPTTKLWKVRMSRAEGVGIRKFQSYFKLQSGY